MTALSRVLFSLLVVVGVLLVSLSVTAMNNEDRALSEPDYRDLVKQLRAHIEKVDPLNYKIVDFAAGKDWFNSSPLSFEKELKGKITVLDFWTYCCINCIHVLPDLAALEKKYAGYPVAFVGVHSAKFENERESENVRDAVLRYEIEHPVINDDEMAMWRAIGVRSWPTLAVVGPNGHLLLMVSGEGNRLVLDAAIAAALGYFPQEAFRHDPLPIRLERDREKASSSQLSYPAKLAVDALGGQLYISDSNNNRIVVTDLEGKFIESIGSGRIGFDDGEYVSATFNRLQGLALDGDQLYVADAENHALRRVDLKKKEVVTLLGNGTQGRDYQGGASGSEQLLSTPWDVVVHDKRVYIAMAGTHQLWVYDIERGIGKNFSGNGSEQNLNHSDPLQAAWSQPSGLTIGDGWLFVADSESSTIRGVELATGATSTFVGGVDAEPRNLFAFGDEDGEGDKARLQHPLGVLWLDAQKSVLVADTYNHRIKLVKHGARTVTTFSGLGERGATDGSAEEASFSEPAGLALHPDGKRVFVADTNNDRIRLLDLASGAVTTLELVGVQEAAGSVAPRSRRMAELPSTATVRGDSLKLRPGQMGEVTLSLKLPAHHHYTDGAPSGWQLLAQQNRTVTFEESKASGQLAKDEETIVIPVEAVGTEATGTLTVEAMAYFCQDGGQCLLGVVLMEIPVEVGTGGQDKVSVEYQFADSSESLTKSPLDFLK